MPAARNGEFRLQALIALWLGASHWSKPRPRKLPGVTGLAAYAGALNTLPKRVSPRAPVVAAARMDRIRVPGFRNGERRRIVISWNIGKCVYVTSFVISATPLLRNYKCVIRQLRRNSCPTRNQGGAKPARRAGRTTDPLCGCGCGGPGAVRGEAVAVPGCAGGG